MLPILLLVLTFSRNAVWATDTALWRDAAAKSPESIRAHSNLGMALYASGSYAEAIRELTRALNIDPLAPEQVHTYDNLGLCLMKMGRTEDAITAFNKALELGPQSYDVYINLGVAYHRMQMYVEEADILRRLLEKDPGFSKARVKLAGALFKLDKRIEAVIELDEAAKRSPDDFDVCFNSALTLMENDMSEMALVRAKAALAASGSGVQRDNAALLLSRLSR